jgi:pimeloyl-ACP methyl ester carboxylesterase
MQSEYILARRRSQPLPVSRHSGKSLVFRSQFHALASHRLHLAVGPDNGPPLLLLHGVLRAWNDWASILDALIPRWKVIGVDFRGHGQSDGIPGQYRVTDYVQDISRLVRDLIDGHSTGEQVTLLGHSLGAMVALAAAAEVPDAVRAVVAEDPPFHTMGHRLAQSPLHEYFGQLEKLHRRPSSIAERAKELADLPVRSPDGKTVQRLGDLRDRVALRFSAACLHDVDHDVFAPIVAGRWLDGYDMIGVFDRIRCPVLLLQADSAVGGMLTDADAELAERTIGECYRERFPGVGHLIHATDTEGMMRRTIAFLESLRTGDSLATARTNLDGQITGKTHRVDGHETRIRHDSHQKRPVG